MRLDRVELIAEMARQSVGVATLAERSRVSKSTITAMRGGKSVRTDTAKRVADALGIPIKKLEA